MVLTTGTAAMSAGWTGATPYNVQVQGVQRRLTLQEYKDMMHQLFENFTIELGQFENMIIRDN